MMTVQRMHKLLGQLIEQGHGRKPVCINKDTFQSPLEVDGACIMEVELITGSTFVGWTDDDGGTKWNQDGSESGRWVVILQGGAD